MCIFIATRKQAETRAPNVQIRALKVTSANEQIEQTASPHCITTAVSDDTSKRLVNTIPVKKSQGGSLHT